MLVTEGDLNMIKWEYGNSFMWILPNQMSWLYSTVDRCSWSLVLCSHSCKTNRSGCSSITFWYFFLKAMLQFHDMIFNTSVWLSYPNLSTRAHFTINYISQRHKVAKNRLSLITKIFFCNRENLSKSLDFRADTAKPYQRTYTHDEGPHTSGRG